MSEWQLYQPDKELEGKPEIFAYDLGGKRGVVVGVVGNSMVSGLNERGVYVSIPNDAIYARVALPEAPDRVR